MPMPPDPPRKAVFTQPGRCRSVAEFRRVLDDLGDLGLAIACDDTVHGAAGALGQPVVVHGHTLRNRFAVHPMEGWDAEADGRPSDWTRRRWRRFGRSGAKLIWGGEAFAVCGEGRANPRQLYLDDKVDPAPGLVGLLDALRGGHTEVGEDPDELLVGLQLTHSGRWSRPSASGPSPRIAYRHPVLDQRVGVTSDAPLLSDGELRALADRFVAAARVAQSVGFAFVDVKCCHGYLLHELLGARHRAGEFGGDFGGRTRLFRLIVDGIRTECPRLHIGVRLSAIDSRPFCRHPVSGVGVPEGALSAPWEHGFGIDPDQSTQAAQSSIDDALEFISLCRELDIRLLNVTAGSPYYNPHLQRPAAYPPSDGYLPPEDPLLGVARHLEATRRCKAAAPGALVVGTGYSYLQEFLPHVAQAEVARGHVDVVGIGRMVLSYPELPLDVLRGVPLDHKRICRTLSDCTTAPRNGLISGCYPLDPGYKSIPEAAALRAAKKAKKG